MGKVLPFGFVFLAAVGALALHWASLAIVLFLIAALGLVSGAMLLRNHSLREYLEYLRHHAD